MKADTVSEQLRDWVSSELSELESRDPDQLYECIAENLSDACIPFRKAELYAEIERQLYTVVVFRKFRDEGDLIALFPFEPWSGNGDCSSYQRIGQHGAAHYTHCIAATVPAKPEEYAALKRELEGIGYSLIVRKRIGRRSK